jgi:hypothetical protein
MLMNSIRLATFDNEQPNTECALRHNRFTSSVTPFRETLGKALKLPIL